MNRELRLALTAVQYFTRVPVPASVGHSAEQLDGATRYFPLVGIGVGFVGANTLALFAQWLPAGVSVLLSMLATVMITGAFHEDGLADSADGLYGGWTVAERLRIMKDSRIGTYGVLALLLIVGMKWSALVALGWQLGACALVFAHTLSRGCAVWVMQLLPYVREDETSRAKPIAKRVSGVSLVVATLTAAAPALLLAWWTRSATGIGIAVLVAVAMTMFMVRLLRSKLGGYTGDALGATQQMCEAAIYVALLAAVHVP